MLNSVKVGYYRLKSCLRGVEKRIKSFYPDINLLSLDFDSGVSDVNITNRMLLFIDNLKNATMNYDNN